MNVIHSICELSTEQVISKMNYNRLQKHRFCIYNSDTDTDTENNNNKHRCSSR